MPVRAISSVIPIVCHICFFKGSLWHDRVYLRNLGPQPIDCMSHNLGNCHPQPHPLAPTSSSLDPTGSVSLPMNKANACLNGVFLKIFN